jgi:cytochrome c-type biogenesis protein CcmE
MSKGLQIAVGAALAALLLGWYGATQIREASFVYYQTLDEFRARGAPGEAARVHGYVAAGSIERDVAAREVRFAVQGHPPHAGGAAGEHLAVVYAGLETPDLFKDGAEVVVEGRLSTAGDGTFLASNVLAKCPSKFEAAEREGARAAL